MESTSETSRILEKGPDYLRKQMDLESEAKGPAASAVERLAASRPKYVKSQQAVSATGEALVSPPLVDPPLVGPPLVDPPLVDPPSGERSSAPPRSSPQSRSPTQVRRSSSKKRPDSILLYRQKCELLRAGGGQRKHHITRKLLRSSTSKPVSVPEAAEKEPDGAEEELGAPRPSAGERRSSTRTPTPERRCSGARAKAPKEPCAHVLSVPASGRAKGVARSRSDISSRYSKNFADFDAFFKYCGLDGEVVESLGKENFSARSDETAVKLRSVSVSASDDGFSRDGSEGLQEEVLHEKIRQGTSVIERNARIIKWLYSCKNAKESGKKLRDLD